MKSKLVLPTTYQTRMRDLLADDYAAYLASLEQPACCALRVNTNKVTVAQFLKIFDRDLQPVGWTSDGFYVDDASDLGLHPYYHAGLFYIQEASAMAPVATMQLADNAIVLDLCAAPGGKAVQISNALSSDGLVVVNDISASRLKIAVHHIERMGIKNAIVTAENIDRLIEKSSAGFDHILVDAPCSGEGMFRKEPKLADHWQADSNEKYAAIQQDLALKARQLLNRHGELTYSTCTFSPIENEQVIARLLNDDSALDIVTINQPVFCAGIACQNAPETVKCARLYPHVVAGEGHFVARLKCRNGISRAVQINAPTNPPAVVQEFFDKVLMQPLIGHFKIINHQVYLLPSRAFDTTGLRVLRSGWLLGKLKGNRFEPAHSFAMGLTAEQVKQTVKLSLDDKRVIKYLKCESLEVDSGLSGWCLVTIDGFSLGWGKAARGKLKNKYPAHLRLVRTARTCD